MIEKVRSCKGINARGEPCQAHAHMVSKANGFCSAHRPGGRQEMARRARLGGKATQERWKREGVTEKELGPLKTVADAQRWLEVIGAGVVSGRLDKGDASAGVRAVEVWIRASDSLTEADLQRLSDKAEAVTSGKQHLRRVR